MFFVTILWSIFIVARVAALDENASNLLSQLRDGFKFVDITAIDGIVLKSIVFNPKPASGITNNPLVIFISSWGLNKWEYIVPANEYADKGYTVVSYTARGFWKSGGEIAMGGILDQQDITTVITWALANTNADPARIGLSGISYGGGLSLLGAAMDSRVKSAVSMSCWVDIGESFLGNGETIRSEAVAALQLLAQITGKPSEELNNIFNDYLNNTNLDYLYSFTYNSSVVNFVDQLNAHNPAVFIANALGDSLFTPNQFIPFFNDKLTVSSKHLEFAPGDHAGPGIV